jgi:hypothetical protein
MLALAAAPAGAQSGDGADPSPIISLDGETPITAEAAEPAPAEREAIASPRDVGSAAPLEPPAPFLAPLTPQNPRWSGRLVGDRASTRFSLVMPQEVTAQALRIAHRSGIDVLPEMSSVTVSLNGVALPPIAPKASDTFEVVDLPADMLRPGANEIRVDAIHHHRIYCGLEANFALWTEIDLAGSGAALADFAPPADTAGFRLALMRQLASGHPLEIRAAPGVPREATLAAASAVARAAGAVGSGVRFTSVWTPSNGPGTHARVTILPGTADATDVRRGGDGALVLRLVVAGDAAQNLADRLAETLPPESEPEAFPLLEPGAPRSLASLGAETVVLQGRYALRDIRFKLPDDWLTLTTRPARLTLRYAAAEGLPPGAQLTVRLNGRAIQLLPLDRPGQARPFVDIDFQAQLLRAGVNELAFEAMVPAETVDMPCETPIDEIVTIDAASTLLAPPSPRMTLPGMAEAVAAIDGSRVATAGVVEPASANGLARLALLRPISGGPLARLTVTRAGDVVPPESNPAGLSRAHVLTALAPARGRDAEAPGVVSLATGARAALDATLAWTERLDDRPLERGLPLETWLDRTRGVAMLLRPDAEDPLALWLVLAPDADLAMVAATLDEARRSGRGPAGDVSILDSSGVWRNWYGPGQRPALREPLTVANAREAAGAYASWSPVVFTMGGVGAVWASALVGVALVRVTRGAGER